MPKVKPSSQKKAKERARQEKRKEKEARRLEAKTRKANAPELRDGEDPDLAGITPGPHNTPALPDLEEE